MFSESCPLEMILQNWVLSFQEKGSGGAYLKVYKSEIALLVISLKPLPETLHFRKLTLPLNSSLTLVGTCDFCRRRFSQNRLTVSKG